MTKNTGQPVRLEMPFRYWIGGINLVAEGENSREAEIRIFKTTPGYRVTIKVGRIGEGWISKEITVPCPSAGSGAKVPDGSGVFFLKNPVNLVAHLNCKFLNPSGRYVGFRTYSC